MPQNDAQPPVMDAASGVNAAADGSTLPVRQAVQQSLTQPPALQDQQGVAAQAMLQVTAQLPDPLNPQGAVAPGGRKTEVRPNATTEFTGLEEIPGAQAVEVEPNVEIAPEVAGWIEKVERLPNQIPQEVVVADATAHQPTGGYAAQPVIVLPMTEETYKKGLRQRITESIRWLSEWCTKIIKKFHGVIVYRTE